MTADSTPLGPPDQWPKALRNAIDLILPSAFQMNVLWGPHCIAFYNDAYASHIGHMNPRNMGRPAREHSPNLQETLDTSFETVRQSGKTLSAREWPFVFNRNGTPETTFCDFSWSPIRDDDGEIGGVLCMVVDVTERVRSARTLVASERKARELSERLQMAQAAGGIGVFLLDGATDTLSVSSEFCRIFGVPERETWPMKEIEQLRVDPNDPMSSRKTRNDRTARLDVEYRIRRPSDGAVRWIWRRAEIVHDANGAAMLARGVVQDITTRKQAEATLRQSEARFRMLAQAVPNQVWTADADGQNDWVSDGMCAYFGLASHALLGDRWRQIVHPDDLPRVEERWAEALAHTRPYEESVRLRRHDGEYRWHLSRAQPVESIAETEPRMRWVGTNTDIDDHKAALLAHVLTGQTSAASGST
ncbi:PAS domain-containing protein [Variovorax rhizosphaerae]|uniref:histidine kinase n=1 Tax=Variovorax rhizosphaerae TaxID=1836200 RepID=A0ABU8WQF6_9BURK